MDLKIDREMLRRAYVAAQESPDPSTQNGAVIPIVDYGETIDEHSFLIEACNTFPRGVKALSERLERPLKYNYIEHAERNAVFTAHRSGFTLSRATLYCPWFACADCARAIIQSGLKSVVGHANMFDATPDHWKGSIADAFTMFEEAEIYTRLVEGPIEGAPKIRFNGEMWDPGA
jgi:dCMP deaminase